MRVTQERLDAVPLIFACYSHRDESHLARLTTHLAQYQQAGELVVWSDQEIDPGSAWRTEIDRALNGAKIGIILVSADLLASAFVQKDELPTLLTRAKARDIVILLVIVGRTDFAATVFADTQTLNDPSKPLRSMRPEDREEVWVKVAKNVRSILSSSATPKSSLTNSSYQELLGDAYPQTADFNAHGPDSDVLATLHTVKDVLSYLLSNGWSNDNRYSSEEAWVLSRSGQTSPIIISGQLSDSVSDEVTMRLIGVIDAANR